MTELDPYREVVLHAPEPVEARLYEVPGARAAAVLVGGVGGGFDSPARDLYARLGAHLTAERIAVLRVRFRRPGDLAASTADVLVGLAWLAAQGVERVGLVGHSFGGAVVIAAAAAAAPVAAVITLATQSSGTEGVSRLQEVPFLLVHGEDDAILPPAASVQVLRRAGPRSELRILPGVDHLMHGAADEVYRLVHAFLVEHLGPGRPAP